MDYTQGCTKCKGPLRDPPVMSEEGRMANFGNLSIGFMSVTIHKRWKFNTDKHETRRYCPKCALIIEDALRELGFEIHPPEETRRDKRSSLVGNAMRQAYQGVTTTLAELTHSKDGR